MLVTKTNDLPGYRVVRHLGVARGVTVRSRSVIGNVGGTIQSLFGGNISVYTRLAETARPGGFRPSGPACAERRGECYHRHAL